MVQDYELLEGVLNELGIKTIPIPRTEVKSVGVPRTRLSVANISKTEYETVNITVLCRGVIEVNKIGYILL